MTPPLKWPISAACAAVKVANKTTAIASKYFFMDLLEEMAALLFQPDYFLKGSLSCKLRAEILPWG
jgi:hypothetical protein